MLHPIRLPDSHIALARTVELQARLMEWLCDPATTAADVTVANLSLREPNVAAWLNWFAGLQDILPAMAHIADLPDTEKSAIRNWFEGSHCFAEHFDRANPAPTAWPAALPFPEPSASHVTKLLQRFYTAAYQVGKGLPFDSAGNPSEKGLKWEQYRETIRLANFGRVCPGCDGDLNSGEELDHWIWKAPYPSLSVCPENLVLLCHKCNSTGQKGSRPTYSAGAAPFADWFHPWLRQAAGKFSISINGADVTLAAIDPVDTARVANLDNLLGLSGRWTQEANSQISAGLITLEVLLEGNTNLTEADARETLIHRYHEAVKSIGKQAHSFMRKAVLDDALANPATILGWMIEARTTIAQRGTP